MNAAAPLQTIQARWQRELRWWMSVRNKNASDLALLLGVTRQAVSNMLNGTSSPSLDSLESYAQALGLTVRVTLHPIERPPEGGKA